MSPIAYTGEGGATPNNLPMIRSAIVGRQEALSTARALLLREDVGLLTFTGPGGVGKTRLALQLASQLLGVTMTEPGCSRLVAVDVDEAVRMATA